MEKLLPIHCHRVMQSDSYTLFLLETSEKRFAIYTDPRVGLDIEEKLTNQGPCRPTTHDLLLSLLKGLDAKPVQVLIYDVEDTIYYAKLFVEQEKENRKTILEIDARPSDCLALAIAKRLPIFGTQNLMDKVIEVEN